MNELKLLPDINEYLENINYNQDCKIQDIDQLAELISAKQHIDKNIAKYIIILYFNEIRNLLINKKHIHIINLGKFSPNKNSVKFKQSKILYKKLNESE